METICEKLAISENWQICGNFEMFTELSDFKKKVAIEHQNISYLFLLNTFLCKSVLFLLEI